LVQKLGTCLDSTMAPYPAAPFVWNTLGTTANLGIVHQPYTLVA
jgi:hypothetical protein